jgi:hypothetical protein
MTDSASQPKHAVQNGVRMVCALVAVLLVGFVVRSLVTLIPPLVVGDDGAYYLVQVRAILRGGALAIPDFPFLFYAQACVARLLSLVMEQRSAINVAVRITDTLLPLTLAPYRCSSSRVRSCAPVTARARAPLRWHWSASWPSCRAIPCSWPGA